MYNEEYNITAKVSCYKHDTFNLYLGLKVCYAKLETMIAYKKVKAEIKRKEQKDRAYRKLLRELE